jgi:trehalose 6-phosphate phosphatase
MSNRNVRSSISRKVKRNRARVPENKQFNAGEDYFPIAAPVITRGRTRYNPEHDPKPLFDSWPEIRTRVHAAKQLAIFLDFDGTLVNLRRRPNDVRVPQKIKRILQSLVRHSNVFVAIVSGRRLRDLRAMFGLEGVHTFGLHGAEREGKKTAIGKSTRRALARAKRHVRSQLGILPGIWLEDKILSLAVHYRGASPAIAREAHAVLLKILAPLSRNLSAMNGEKVWEILPREIMGKGATIQELLTSRARQTLAIYAGDDAADESAFAAIPDQITVQVGNRNSTCARFSLRDPREMLRFLTLLERELT